MSRVAQLAQRAKRLYVKPELPAGPFILTDEKGWEDGLFYREHLSPSDLPGKPWVFAGVGSPKVFRVKKQVGNKLHCEDGVFTITALPPERIATPGWA